MPPRHICCSYTLPPSHSLYLILSHTFIKKKKFSLSWLFLYLTSSFTSLFLSPLELPDLFISSINYFIFSSTSLSLSPLELPDLFIYLINYLTFSSTSLSLSPLELSDLFISPINCTLNFLFKSCAEIFFSLHVVPRFCCCLSLKGAFYPFWFLCLCFCCCIHLGGLSCMSMWIKLYKVIVMFIV